MWIIAKLTDAVVLKKSAKFIKILGEGEITKKLNVGAPALSESAKAAIEAAGGTTTIIEVDKADHAKKAKSAK